MCDCSRGVCGFSCVRRDTHCPSHPAHPQVQLVLEYCDKGCLRDALDDGVFFGREYGTRHVAGPFATMTSDNRHTRSQCFPYTWRSHGAPSLFPAAATGLNYAAILETAADVAKALLHLHLNNVLHGGAGRGMCISGHVY